MMISRRPVPGRSKRRKLTPRALPAVPARLPMAGPMMPPGAGPPGMPPGMPSMKKGGVVKKTGPHKLHKGETVVPAKKHGPRKR